MRSAEQKGLLFALKLIHSAGGMCKGISGALAYVFFIDSIFYIMVESPMSESPFLLWSHAVSSCPHTWAHQSPSAEHMPNLEQKHPANFQASCCSDVLSEICESLLSVG